MIRAAVAVNRRRADHRAVEDDGRFAGPARRRAIEGRRARWEVRDALEPEGAYPLFEEVEDGDVSEPIFSIHDSTPESALREFVAHGFAEGAHQNSSTGSNPSVGFGHR